MSLLNRALRYASVWLRPPRVATLEATEIDGPILRASAHALPFVEPIFVLSTGRCGTKWLTELLHHDPRIRVNHHDYPELIRHSRLAYEQYEAHPRLFQEVLRATRDGYLLDAYQRHLTYVETNNRITFFAVAIRAVYPKARFIHLVRHPGDFVRSGLRRDWYHGERHDVGRIRLVTDQAAWKAMSNIEKIAWLWNESNQYIETFLASLDTDDFLQVKAEEMFADVQVMAQICDFIGAAIGKKTMTSMLGRKVNQQRFGSKQEYGQWDAHEKAQVRKFATLASRYGYQV